MKYDEDAFYEIYSDINGNHKEIKNNTTPEYIGADDSYDNPYIVICEAFNIWTYDSGISTFVGEQIWETLTVLKNKSWVEHISDEGKNYYTFVIINNLLDFNDMIEWGTSIRSAWLTEKGEKTFNFIDKFIKQWNKKPNEEAKQ